MPTTTNTKSKSNSSNASSPKSTSGSNSKTTAGNATKPTTTSKAVSASSTKSSTKSNTKPTTKSTSTKQKSNNMFLLVGFLIFAALSLFLINTTNNSMSQQRQQFNKQMQRELQNNIPTPNVNPTGDIENDSLEPMIKESGNCSLVPDTGNCRAAFTRYFFNPETSKCEEFIWGGCEGTVPFETLESCQFSCENIGQE